MIEISKPNDFKETSAPEESGAADFYAGASRAEILRQLIAAVHAGTPLMILAGEEGSGKTLLCRMLEKELSGDTRVVFFPQSIESFEDVIKGLAEHFGFGGRLETKEKLFDSFYKNLAVFLQNEPGRVVVIFDESENLYLATLERIRKLLDRITLGGVYLQLVFSGRMTLLENIEQLSICDFKNKDELSIVLPSLTNEESLEFIKKYEKKQAFAEEKTVDDEIRASIAEKGNGNFKKILMFTREATLNQENGPSFMVLLENIKTSEPEISKTPARKFDISDRLLRYKKYLPHIGVGLFAFSILLWVVWPDSEKESVLKSKLAISTEIKEAAPPVAPIAIESKAKKTKASSRKNDTGGKGSSSVTTSNLGQQDTSQTEKDVKTYSLGESGKNTQTLPREVEQAIIKTVTEKVAKESIVLQANAGNQGTAPQMAKQETVKEEAKAVELWPRKELKKKPEKKQEIEIIAAKQTKQIISATNAVQEVVASNAHLATDQLLRKRMVASAPWQRGKKDDQYTVQLMMLTAKNGEDNLKKMFEDDDYRKEASNFFVFKKRSSPDVIFIFYGEYPTMSFARLAKNNLPKFLQKHKPYPISVKGAMAKVNQ